MLSSALVSAGMTQTIAQYKYNIYGEMTKSIDAGGKASQVAAYNVFGQPTATIDRMGNVSHMKYDANGNVIASWIDKANGNISNNVNEQASPEFTKDNYLITSEYQDIAGVQRLVKIEDINGSITHQYYPDGQGKSVSYQDKNAQRGSREFQYRYDSVNRTDTLTELVNGEKSYQTDMIYGSDGKLEYKTIYDEKQGHKPMIQDHYLYEDTVHPDRLSSIVRQYTNSTGELAGKLTYTYTYDMLGRKNGMKVTAGVGNKEGDLLYEESYIFNTANQIDTYTQDYGNNQKTISHYTYGIPEGINGASEVLLSYKIDPASTVYPQMMVNEGQGPDKKEQVVFVTGQNYQYTDNYGLKEMQTSYKHNLQDTSEHTLSFSYRYDPVYKDRVIHIQDSSQPDVTGEFKYDAEGNVTIDQWGTRYIHNPLRQLEELIPEADTGKTRTKYTYNTSGKMNSAIPEDGKHSPVYYNYSGGKLASQTQNIDGQSVTANYFGNVTLYDQNHSDKNRVNFVSYRQDVVRSMNLDSANSEKYVYTPYGMQSNIDAYRDSRNKTLNILDNIFGYTNQIFDPAAQGNQMGGKRLWDPKYGISVSHDTIKQDNPYMTMHGNPMAYIDPTGNSVMGDLWGALTSWQTYAIAGVGIAAAGVTAVSLGALAAPTTAAATAAIAGLAGGAAGLASASTSAALYHQNWAKHMHDSGWIDVTLGAVAAGAAGGITGTVAKGVLAGAAVDAASGSAQSAVTQGLMIATGQQNQFDWDQFAVDSIMNTVTIAASVGAARLGEHIGSRLSNSSQQGACFTGETVVWVRRRRADGSSRFLGEMFSEYDIVEIEVEGAMHEIILLPICLIEVGDEVLSMPEDYRPELDEAA